MSSGKRKAEHQLTRPGIRFIQPPRTRTNTMTSRHVAAAGKEQPNVFIRAWNGIAQYVIWACASTDTDMTDATKEEDGHNQTSGQIIDVATSKRQRIRRSDVLQRPKSAGAAYARRTTATKGPINFESARDDKERREAIDNYWDPPQLGWGLTNTTQRPITSEDDSALEGLDESVNGMRLDAAASPESSSSLNSLQHYGSSTPRRPHYLPATPESLPQKYIRPTKSTGNLDMDVRKDSLDSLLGGDLDIQGLRISGRKKTELEVLRKDREKRELQEKRKAAKQRRLVRQAPLKPLIQALDTKWDDRVTDVQYSRDMVRTLTKSLEGTELRVKDFATLLGKRAWLNDEIINTYIEWIVTAANKAADADSKAAGEPVSTVPKFLAHNSFFWNNLRDKGPKSTERLMKRKKAPGTSLLEVDTVFIPINKGAHWTIGLVRPVAKTIEYLDSMGGRGSDVIPVLRAWVKHQLGSQYVENEWTVPQTKVAYQSNGYDCGVFVCTNAFCVTLGLNPDCYHERDLTQQRKNIAAVLLNRGFEGDFSWNSEGFLG